MAAGLLLVMGVGRSVAQDAEVAPDPPECYDCHDEVHLARTPHSAIDTRGIAAQVGAASSCEACHGDPTEHIESGGEEGSIFAFGGDDMPNAKSERCQSCHGGQHPQFTASSHGRTGLDCTSCHSVHDENARFAQLKPWPEDGSALETVRVSGSCRSCHDSIFAQFQFPDRHRLEEGIVGCVDCHNPHEPSTRMALGGFKDQLCADCHTDKGGPFVFEHGASPVEGCTSCHAPHGSPNRYMLHFQSVAELCYSCHPSQPHTFGLDRQCTDCHRTIHGSNFNAAFLK